MVFISPYHKAGYFRGGTWPGGVGLPNITMELVGKKQGFNQLFMANSSDS